MITSHMMIIDDTIQAMDPGALFSLPKCHPARLGMLECLRPNPIEKSHRPIGSISFGPRSQ